jgi:hypothetical protein
LTSYWVKTRITAFGAGMLSGLAGLYFLGIEKLGFDE